MHSNPPFLEIHVGVRRGRRGFSLAELLVVVGIVIILLSIFIPYLLSIRESSNRTRCADKLRQIRNVLQAYAAEHEHNYPRVRYDAEGNPNGYVAFSGPDDPDPFAEQSSVQPNDVSASLWLLVRGQLVGDTSVFVCPSSNDWPDRITDASGRATSLDKRSNFRGPSNLSYSYASPFSSAPGFRLNSDWLKPDFALMADKNPGTAGGDDVAGPRFDAPARELGLANSNNHDKAGQNVLFADGSVRFETSPYCGVGRAGSAGGDNIYTARAAAPATQPIDLPYTIQGFLSPHIGPATSDDSYLVPTDDDRATPARPRELRPATTQSTPQPVPETPPSTTSTAPSTSP